MPAVSVVIPAHNAASTIRDTLASLSAQSFRDFEAIVIDDGSADDTARVAEDCDDERIRVISVENGGVATARNVGIEAAAGELLAFLDADDLWLPAKLERQLERLHADASAGMCVTAATRIDAAGRKLGPMPLAHAADNCSALLLGSMVLGCVSSGVFRRAVLKRAGAFNPRFSQCADWDLWLRASTVTRIALVDEPLVLYRSASGNMSSDIELLERDTFAVLDAFFDAPQGRPYAALRRRAYATHWMICSGSYLHSRRLRPAVRCLLRGLWSDPRTIGRPMGLPVRLVRRLARGQVRPR